MTERNFGSNIEQWIGIVTNVMDPHQSGRVQVRILGKHDDVANIPNEDLPFAQIIQPVTSAARGRIGTAPVGLVVGSRVYGVWLDQDHQYPLILGSVGRAGEASQNSTEGGAPTINTDAGSIPSATQQAVNNAYASLDNPQRVTIDQIDSGAADIDSVSRDTGVVITKVVEDHMEFAKIPTIGSIDETDIDILDALRQVDPSSSLSSLPCFPANIIQVSLVLDLGSLAAGFINMLSNALIDALLEIADRIGIGNVLSAIGAAANGIANFQDALNAVMEGGICGAPRAIGSLSAATQSMAYAFGNIQMAAKKAGNAPNAIRDVLGRTSATIKANTPTAFFRPAALVSVAPIGYVQEYYSASSDPYPGYIKWIDPDNSGDPAFTLRNGQPNFASATEHTTYESRIAATSSLGQSISSSNLTTNQLQTSLNLIEEQARNSGMKNSIGAGFNPSQIGSMIGLIPLIYNVITGNFIPKINVSILPNSGQIQQAMTRFSSSQAMLERQGRSMELALRSLAR